MSVETLLELRRFRVVCRDEQTYALEVRSGRLTGEDTWYPAQSLGDWQGFVRDLGRSLRAQKEGK